MSNDFYGNKFKEKGGRWRTQSLFIDSPLQWNPKDYPPMYTLGDERRENLPTFRELYLECNDPTEYTIATTYFGGWDHWKHLKSLKWFEEKREKLQDELEVLYKAKAVKRLMELSEDSKSAMSATTAIFNQVWKDKERGRPSKAEIARKTKINSDVQKSIEEDFKIIKYDSRKAKTDKGSSGS